MEHFKLALILSTVLFWSPTSAQSKLVVASPQFLYVKLNSNILLDCSTPDNSLDGCRVGWVKGAGSRVQNDSHYTIYCNGSLAIRDITEGLIGVDRPYRCYDNHAVFDDSDPVFIELRNLPVPVVRDITAVEGDTTNLNCNVDGARPHPSELKWYHNGTLLQNERFSELTLTNVHRSQSGNYTCVVIVDDDMATGSGTLIVTYVDITNTTATNIIGVYNTSSTIMFGCQASGIPMVTSIKWTHPPDITFHEQLQFSDDNSIVIATGEVVGRIGFSHTGVYRCTATNNVTTHSILFSLIVKGPPAAPEGLMLLSISAYEAQLMWTTPFDGHDAITAYFIFVWTDNSNFTISTSQPVILLMELRPNTQYQYRVVAQNGYGNGSSSENGDFTTLSLSPPTPPNNVQVVVINSTSVNVSWEIPQFNSSVGTILYTSIQYIQKNAIATRRSTDRRYFTSEQTVRNKTSVLITGLAKGTMYTFIICLGNKEGKGPCEEIKVTTPKTAPSAPVVMATVNSTESIQVSWTVQDNGGNPDLSYSLRQWSDHDGTRILLLSNSEITWYLVDHLIPNTTYWFSVVAHSDSGDSPEGWSQNVTTKPLPPGAPVSLAVMGNVITWLPSDIANSNTGTAAFYIVQYTLETLDWPVDSNMVSTMQPMVELTRYVTAGSRYRVRVRAGNHGGLSDWSNAVIVTPVDQPTTAAVAGSSSDDSDKIVIAVVCTAISVAIILVIMIIIFCMLYYKRQIIRHTYKINSIVELDDEERARDNTYTMISGKPNDELPEITEHNIDSTPPMVTIHISPYKIDTTMMDTQMATITLDDRNKTPSPLMFSPTVRITTPTDTTDV